MSNYWLCISTISNYLITESKNIWGVSKKHQSQLMKLKPKDKIIFYIKGRQLGDIFEVDSKPYVGNSDVFFGGKFPYRIKIKLTKSSNNIHILTDKMIKDLDLFKYKDFRWKFKLYGKAIILLSEKDFNYLNSKI